MIRKSKMMFALAASLPMVFLNFNESIAKQGDSKRPCIGPLSSESNKLADGKNFRSSENLFLFNDDKLIGNEKNYVLNSGLRLAIFGASGARAFSRDETIKKLSDSIIQDEISEQAKQIGISKSVAELLRVPKANRYPAPNDPKLKLLLNKLCFRFTAKGLSIEVIAKKEYNSSEIDGFRVGIWYKWEILAKKIFAAKINMPRGKKLFNFKIHARSPDIMIENFELGFDVDHDDHPDTGETARVVPFYKDGTVNPLYAVLSPNNTDCIDIDIAVKDGSLDITYEPNEYDLGDSTNVAKLSELLGKINKKRNGIQFCAGSCSGYMLAASNGG